MAERKHARGRRFTRSSVPTGGVSEQLRQLYRDINRLMDELERELARIEKQMNRSNQDE